MLGKVRNDLEWRPAVWSCVEQRLHLCYHLRPVLPRAMWAVPAWVTTASALPLGSLLRETGPSHFRLAHVASLPQLAEGVCQFSAVPSTARSCTLANVGS